MSDLHTLLREHVTGTEPLLPPDPGPAIAGGRRRLRARRTGVAVAAAAVVLAGVATVPLLPGGHGGSHSQRGIDPATRRALAQYDAQQMPRILEDRVSSVLRRSVAYLPPAHFRAGDGQGAALQPADYDKASGMSVTYGADSDHRFQVSLSHARSEAEGDARQICEDDVRSGIYVSCDVTVTGAGDVVTARVAVLRPLPSAEGEEQTWMAVPAGRVDRANPGRLWFSREVKVVHSETFLTYASEVVHAPTLAAADRAFEVPVPDLVEIGTDPQLVIPPPPTDDSGCGPWTLDPDVSYC